MSKCLSGFKLLALSAMLSFSVSCGVEDTADQDESVEPLGVAHEEFGFLLFAVNPRTYSDGGGVLIGPTSGNFGFLMGVSGNLGRTGPIVAPGGAVGVQPTGPNWFVFSNPGSGGPTNLQAIGGIAPGSQTVATFIDHRSSAPSFEDKFLAPYNGGLTRCFLTHAADVTGEQWSHFEDSLGVVQVGSSWYLRGIGHVYGGARCTTVSTFLGKISVGGQGTFDLGPFVDGKVCWLSRLAGAFRSTNMINGSRININTNLSRWELIQNTGKGSDVECSI